MTLLLIIAPPTIALALLTGALIALHREPRLSEQQHQLIGRYHAK